MSDLSDLLERFRRGAELLAVVTTGAAGPELDFKPGGAPLSIRQLVCHLADAEVVTAMRLRHVIAEDNPILPAYDGGIWAEKLDYAKRKLSQPLETFRRLRAENFELLKDLPEATFTRVGTHAQDGPVTLRQLVEAGAQHVEEHVRDIQSIRGVYREQRAKRAADAAAQPAT
jgi:hypothetical protein